MNITGVVLATVVVSVIGILVGLMLGFVGAKFRVKVNEKEVAVRELLPGNNCGACGYAGCDGLAAAIANGTAPVMHVLSGELLLQMRLVKLWE